MLKNSGCLRCHARDEVRTAPLEAISQSGRSLFTGADIPALLARADGYSGKGQYDRAISLYQEVLKIDPRNQSAREGLQRAREARGLRP